MFVLTREGYDSVLDHAQADTPREACGVFVGERDGDLRRVTAVRRVPNVADAPRMRYELDPEATLAVFDEAAAVGREVVGFYHSHPVGPGRPSATDREHAQWPDRVYVVASLAARPPILDAWLWTGEAFERQAVAVR
ncbi:desampylase [Halobacterium sp. MBLA0001]|uniref:desampylase n=1 Tax=Halobacterium TaxID=2239 RepID=UPI001F276207|nr:desampylase [Halobacterium salinarum]MCF2164739.1 M67 family metallopeptidase [Halobacterium salinarum]MCF2167582.1 M67 family metallopeptidase [Halobacterium salinarum]MCF2238799.1 M67 family metallopeptidase [Halobacterium salinarum]MDL0124587.1 desampylase [Halobacterium salinarum]MDL0128117.1 desampylase [Halobacterium salinarum]